MAARVRDKTSLHREGKRERGAPKPLHTYEYVRLIALKGVTACCFEPDEATYSWEKRGPKWSSPDIGQAWA